MNRKNKILILGNPDTERALREFKTKFSGVYKLAAGIAAAWNPAVKASADKAVKDEQIRARWKMMEEVKGFPINSENQYEKAAAGAPREIIENDKITAQAWQMCAGAYYGRGSADHTRLMEWYTERFK